MDKAQSGSWYLLRDNAPSHNETIVKLFLAKKTVTVLYHPPLLAYRPPLLARFGTCGLLSIIH
jgi:hypothetical protein